MFEAIDIQKELQQQKHIHRLDGNHLITEANRILKKDLFSDKKILQNLKAYSHSHELLDEEDLDRSKVFTLVEIKKTCISNRLKCLDSPFYKPEIPYEAILTIKHLNERYQKELKYFKVLGTHASFSRHTGEACVLLAKTNYDNYYIIHQWGQPLKWNRKLRFWHMRHFENLFVTVTLLTLFITLCLPTAFISLDERVGYFSGFRIAAFFHLLIFNMGVTAYISFAFTKNFSASVWNQVRDFD